MQVQKIRFALRGIGHPDVKVGSTEMFQGQERRIVIISTVRSSEDYVGFDLRHNIGFLDNPKRFNVSGPSPTTSHRVAALGHLLSCPIGPLTEWNASVLASYRWPSRARRRCSSSSVTPPSSPSTRTGARSYGTPSSTGRTEACRCRRSTPSVAAEMRRRA